MQLEQTHKIYLQDVATRLILFWMEIRGRVDCNNKNSPCIYYCKNGFSTQNSPLVIFSLWCISLCCLCQYNDNYAACR
jgi:hypothetical protein